MVFDSFSTKPVARSKTASLFAKAVTKPVASFVFVANWLVASFMPLILGM